MELSHSAVRQAASVVSASGAFAFTPRNLYYELIRQGAWAEPQGAPRAALVTFRQALKSYERARGSLPGLIRAGDARRAVPQAHLPDVFDYSVRRVLLFQRVETMLLFAMNGFHRRVEAALLAFPGFPAHVNARLERQLEGGLRTAFYAVHDATAAGYKLNRRAKEQLSKHGRPRVADVGLRFAQAFQIGIKVRSDGRVRRMERGPKALEDQLLLDAGNYAHLEELPPLALMRWTYDRVARGSEELGFG
jgi:hypothetical protein